MTGSLHRLRLRKWGAGLLLLVVAVGGARAGAAAAEQASEPTSPAAGQLTTGRFHNCAVQSAALRCWGYGGDGQLGYGDKRTIGDDETPAAAGPLDFGAGRTAIAISAGNVHTCALLDDRTVRCWGFGGNGRLGYGNTNSIGDDPGETPATAGSVFLGTGRSAKAISAGDGHSCAILDDDSVRCWGYGFDGRLGLNNTESIGDNETPGSVPPINFGAGRTAKAISAGSAHTCAILDDNTVRCWGFAGAGRLGYGTLRCLPAGQFGTCPVDVGRGCFLISNQCNPDPNAPTIENMGPVDVGAGRTARAISAGQFHTCAVLDNSTVRCWGTGGSGRLGYGNGDTIGDDETPGGFGPVDLGAGGGARAVTAGGEHTCAVLNDGNVRCWGQGVFGQLGYPDTASVGQTEDPGDVGPVGLGTGRTAKAISAGDIHTCARLDDDSVRCWGYGANGRLGYCNDRSIGDDETPGSVGPVDLGSGGARCPTAGGSSTPPPSQRGVTTPPVDPSVAEQARLQGLRDCLSRVRTHARRELRRARRLGGARRTRALRHARRHRRQLRRRCLRLHGRTPGRVTGLTAQAIGGRRVVLTFKAPGSDGSKPPAARTYLVKQSRRPIRSKRAFNRARSLCRGRCSFDIKTVGATLKLTVTDLRRRGRYYFAVKARDNVSKRTGPRSGTVRVRVR